MLERKQLTQEELLRLIDAVPGMVYQFKMTPDQEFGFEFVSEGIHYFGRDHSASEDSFLFFTGLFEAEDMLDFVPTVLESAKNLTHWQKDFRYIHPEKGLRWITASSQPQKMEDGSVVWNGQLWDSTEQKQIELSLKEAITARDSFISIASHELKTPTTVILLKLQMLKRKFKEFDEIVDGVNSAITQVERLNRQIENLFTSHALNEIQTYEKESYDLTTMVDDIFDSFALELKSNNMSFISEVDPEMKTRISRLKIGQIIKNLMSNAIRYAPQSELIVKVCKTDKIEITVSDTGLGIPENQLDGIFERFQRGGNRHNISGLGLGLYVTRRIVEDLKGTIDIYSELGKGTQFYICIPDMT